MNFISKVLDTKMNCLFFYFSVFQRLGEGDQIGDIGQLQEASGFPAAGEQRREPRIRSYQSSARRTDAASGWREEMGYVALR